VVNLAPARHPFDDEVVLTGRLSSADSRRAQRLAQAGDLKRLAKGVYVRNGSDEEVRARVRRNWQRIAGALVPGGVVSHRSAMTSGLVDSGQVYLSHPTLFARTHRLPGVSLVLLRGPGPLPDDLPLGDSGLHWASRPRLVLENLGKSAPRRLGRDVVEKHLVDVLAASGEQALNTLRDKAAAIAPALGADRELSALRALVGALLGTHGRGELRTEDGRRIARGTPVDKERLQRLEVLAQQLRIAALPAVADPVRTGMPRQNFAFVESYFSNYVEGTRFDIEQARGIVMNNEVVSNRPKDSHDILGVFRLALSAPYRSSPPSAGTDFVEGLQSWHAEMLRMRPEAHPGQLKLEPNFAGTTRFVEPMLVRGTLIEGSRLALSVPEGAARAMFYAFLVSEVHPFEDGNGRLSRLVMNAELSRVGLCRIIIPTLFHPQYVDRARALTRQDDPPGFITALAKMARWTAGFDYEDLNRLIANLRRCNALEESPAQSRLLDAGGVVV
jgi:hypothetical protein